MSGQRNNRNSADRVTGLLPHASHTRRIPMLRSLSAWHRLITLDARYQSGLKNKSESNEHVDSSSTTSPRLGVIPVQKSSQS